MKVRVLSALLAFTTATAAIPAIAAYTQEQQWELNVGKQEYAQLYQQGVLVSTRSPLYAKLEPIGRAIARVANKQYFVPFTFYLVKSNQPNAFSVPGGHVYVTTAMMSFAQNREELAGVLCHEVSHDIHHDVYDLAKKKQGMQAVGLLAAILTRNSAIANTVAGLGLNMWSNSFSRPVESAADHTGAYICARAGINPWGMVWLFKRFESKPSGVPLEALSDHPRDDHRVTDLENEFRSDPATFGRFSSNVATAHPL
jgi:predicted Zn-dependent protease